MSLPSTATPNSSLAISEDRIERLLYSLSALADIGEATTAGGSFETTARELLHLILGTLAISKGAILLYDTASEQLRPLVARGIESPPSIPLPANVVERLRLSMKPLDLLAKDQVLTDLVRKAPDAFAALQARLWVPLAVGGRLVGVLSLSDKFGRSDYTSDDLQLLATMAQHASLALYNFQIIGELQEANFRLKRKVLEMQSLYDVGLAIGALHELDPMANEIIQRAVMLLDASAGVLFSLEKEGLRVAASFGMYAEYPPKALLPLDQVRPRAIHEIVIAEQRGCRLNEREQGGARNYAILPLIVSGQVVGALMVCDKQTREGYAPFTEEDEQFLLALATQAAIAIENARLHQEAIEKERIEKELEVAAAIQKRILPDTSPVFDTVETIGVNISCRQVGGDYYDYICFDEPKLGLVIADVSGKGTPAALLVSTLQASFRALVESHDLAETVTRLNKVIYKASPSYNYITFFYGVLDLETRRFRSINAGHNDPLLYRPRTGEWQTFGSGGFCLGMFDWGTYEVQETQLEPGDLLFLYTDGVTESTNEQGEEFGEERVRALLAETAHLPLAEISARLSAAIRDFVGAAPQHDDLTYVLARVK
ncbi:SpoIIE family protein phosphatase [Chloracidobacterium sp. D]|uniref:GAF domain-containing SpoIIE family protein phosphatase n=1 Tax=Chloracidobacterium sp. D TaxID=2821536 RepID=UPI001B8D9FE2|nr:SpoIIE family protein phosphatase [Chloracidobacterium sp. D]QUV81366.1 SpoIIE family protein phosphatase [Chloracidobacterium sp. D]